MRVIERKYILGYRPESKASNFEREERIKRERKKKPRKRKNQERKREELGRSKK